MKDKIKILESNSNKKVNENEETKKTLFISSTTYQNPNKNINNSNCNVNISSFGLENFKKENEQLNEKINNLNNQIESLNLDKSNLEVTLSQKISENKNLTKALKEKEEITIKEDKTIPENTLLIMIHEIKGLDEKK